MAKTATLHVRMDEKTKEDAIKVFDALGIGVADAVNLYFKQVALKNGIPFELSATKADESNFSKVSKIKQDDLQKVLNVIPESVDELWVFGSAVTPYCKPESDLDICIVGDKISKEDRKVLAHAPRRGMDLIDVSHADFDKQSKDKNNLFYNVKNRGMLIYKKGEGMISG